MSKKLADLITARIRAGGPISIADYMAECLLHPDHGYYAQREPFGSRGDFVTAPEISQLFGEIIGVWLVHAWRQAGRPAPFVLAEAGPGRGTLMADILRTARIDPAFGAAAQVALVEASTRLRAIQKETIGALAPGTRWFDRLEDLPDGPLFLVGNEFLDALPIRQFVKTASDWWERLVGLDQDERLHFVAGPATLPDDALPPDHAAAPPGAIFEASPAREAVAATLAGRIARDGGLALLIDYGHSKTAIGDTFQAMRDHAFADPLAEPGLADLTSHVDFGALARVAAQAGAEVLPILTQSDFLVATGIVERAGALGSGKDTATQTDIRHAVERLCGQDAGQMGALFKVLCLTGPDFPRPLAPFETQPQAG